MSDIRRTRCSDRNRPPGLRRPLCDSSNLRARAIFLTGYLGGAVATHVRVGDPLISHVLFTTYVAAMICSQRCPARGYSSALNRKTQEEFRCVWPTCGFSGNADDVAAQNQLRKFLSSDKGVALLASGYRASGNSLRSGQSWDSTRKQEPIEEAAPCA